MTSTTHPVRPLPAPPAPAPAALPGRRLAVAGLVVGAVLNTAEAVLLQFLPERPEDVADQLPLVADHLPLFTTRLVAGTLAIPFMVIAFLAAARLLATRARRAAAVAGTLLAAGMWGFVGVHLLGLLQVPASAADDPAAAAALLTDVEASPLFLLLFLLPFLAGSLLGMVVLTVGLLVTGAVPRWIPAAWLVFVLLDFSVGAVGPVDPHWLWLAGALGLAAHLLRSPRTDDVVARTA
ncbi:MULTISPECIES: hypothetical protein [unclassified Blastococcus]